MEETYIDDPMAEIMAEANEGGGATSTPARWLNQVGKTGRYHLGGLTKEELDADPPPPLAERKKVRALILYAPNDPGRALWPDGKIFVGTSPLCQSERSQAPYDAARMGKVPALDKAALKGMGHTGKCSTCGIGTDLCKVRLVAYIVDLDYFKLVNDFNKANPNAEPMEHCFTKLDAKGPQNYYNFMTCYRALVKQCQKEKNGLSDYIVEFSSEPGAQGSHKVSFKPVDLLPEDSPLRSFCRVLAREALASARVIRKSFSALPSTTHIAGALPAPSQSDADSFVVDVDEIPF